MFIPALLRCPRLAPAAHTVDEQEDENDKERDGEREPRKNRDDRPGTAGEIRAAHPRRRADENRKERQDR